MSKNYPIFETPKTTSELYYYRSKEDTLVYRMDDIKAKLRERGEWADKSDEELESYIVSLIFTYNNKSFAAFAKRMAYDMDDPRDAEWKQYTYEEIIEMYKDGIDVPEECLEWAYAQAASDTDVIYDIDIQNSTNSMDIDQLDFTSGPVTYKEEKEAAQIYSEKANVQSEFLNDKAEDLSAASEDVEYKMVNFEFEKQSSEDRIRAYMDEYKLLEEKFKSGKELSGTELVRYNNLNSLLNNESKSLIVSANNLEDELANLNSELNTVNSIIDTNLYLEDYLDNAYNKYSTNDNYNVNYMPKFNIKGTSGRYTSQNFNLTGYQYNFLNLIYSSKAGDLSLYSLNSNLNLVSDTASSASTVQLSQDIKNSAETLISSVVSTENSISDNNVAVPENSENSDINTEDNLIAEQNVNNVVSDIEDTANIPPEESVVETPIDEDVNASDNLENQNENIEDKPLTEENPMGITVQAANNTRVEISSENIVPKTQSVEVVPEENEQEPIQVQNNYTNTTQESDKVENNAEVTENSIESTEAEKQEETEEIEETEVGSSFDEVDKTPEEMNINTTQDSMIRNNSFADIESDTQIAELDINADKSEALKYDNAGTSARASKIPAIDFVANADGTASVSGIGQSMDKNDNIIDIESNRRKSAEVAEDIKGSNSFINTEISKLNNLSGRNFDSFNDSSKIPAVTVSSSSSSELKNININMKNLGNTESDTYHKLDDAEDMDKKLYDASTDGLEKRDVKNNIAHLNEKSVSADIDDDSYDEVSSISDSEFETKTVSKLSDDSAADVLLDEVPGDDIIADGLTAKIAEHGLSTVLQDTIQDVSNDITVDVAENILDNNNDQAVLNNLSNEAAKTGILTYGEKVQQKDNNRETKRKVLTRFEIKRRDEIKRGIEKVSSSAKMKHS